LRRAGKAELPFAACVLGIITAVGGGTVRDLILEVPVFWVDDQNYHWVALVACLVAFRAGSVICKKRVYQAMLYLDALGVSLFAIQAMHKVIELEFGLPLAPIMLGVVTAIGGGILRDLLAGSPMRARKPPLERCNSPVRCRIN
jgi:uncharacterized membrane protein YeiH